MTYKQMSAVGNTGQVPAAPANNEFANANNAGSNSSNNSPNNSPNSSSNNSSNNAVEGEGGLATANSPDIATSEPVVNATPALAASATSKVSKSGKPLSAAQSNVQRLRAETLEDMRAKYAKRFGNSSKYPKPPKAKAYHASGLTSLRQRDGENAYNAALKVIMDKNDPALGTNGKSQLTLTRKAKKGTAAPAAAPAAAAPLVKATNALANNSAARANLTRSAATVAPNKSVANAMTASMKEMGTTAKQLIDAMINTSNLMTRYHSKNAGLAPLTNTLKAKKPRVRATAKKAVAPLPTLYESNVAANASATAENNENSPFDPSK